MTKVRLPLGRQGLRIRGLSIDNAALSGGHEVSLSLQQINFNFQWKKLWQGKVVCRGSADTVQCQLLRVRKNGLPGEHAKPRTSKIIPIELQEFDISNSEFIYTDATTPDLEIELNTIRASLKGLSSIPSENDPATVTLSANVCGGSLSANMKVNLAHKLPVFDLNAELTGMDLTQLNPLFRAHGKFDVSSGRLSLFSEVAAAEGKFKGYVKPVIKNLEVVGVEDRHEGLFQKLWEVLIQTITEALRNQHKDQLATKIPFEGRFKPHVNTWFAIMQTLVNAFVTALQPSLDYDIDIGTVKRSTNGVGAKHKV